MNFIFHKDSGISVVEIVLIIIVLISLVLIFRTQLTAIIKNIFTRMSADSSRI